MDENLVTTWAIRFRDGDEPSFDRLVGALTRTLVAMAYRYTDDWEWARDLTQETWIRVHENIHRYDPARSFVSWLHSVHRNGCLDWVRRPWVRRETTPGDDVVDRLAGASEGDPSEELERLEFRERVLEAARGLSESRRRAFVGVDVEQKDPKEVAREMGIRPGTLRTTLHFARRKVAEALRGTKEES